MVDPVKRIDLPVNAFMPERGRTQKPKRDETYSTRTASGQETRLDARVFDTADQLIATATPTFVTWASESFDSGGFHNNAVNNERLTIPGVGGSKSSGLWLVHTMLRWDAGAMGNREVEILQNANTIAHSVMPGLSATQDQSHDVYVYVLDPAVGDFFRVRVTHSQGAGLNLVKTNSTVAYFEVIHVW